MKFPGNNGSRQSTANPLHHFLTSSDLVKIEGPYTLHTKLQRFLPKNRREYRRPNIKLLKNRCIREKKLQCVLKITTFFVVSVVQCEGLMMQYHEHGINHALTKILAEFRMSAQCMKQNPTLVYITLIFITLSLFNDSPASMTLTQLPLSQPIAMRFEFTGEILIWVAPLLLTCL